MAEELVPIVRGWASKIQANYPIEAAFNGIKDQHAVGFAYGGSPPPEGVHADFYFESETVIEGVVLYSGAQRPDHHLVRFALSAWGPTAVPTSIEGVTGAAVSFGGILRTPATGYARLAFPPIPACGLRLTIFETDVGHNNVVLNEIEVLKGKLTGKDTILKAVLGSLDVTDKVRKQHAEGSRVFHANGDWGAPQEYPRKNRSLVVLDGEGNMHVAFDSAHPSALALVQPEVLGAMYGTRDVTSEVCQQIGKGVHRLPASNDMWGDGDPNVSKQLTIFLKVGEEILHYVAFEGEDVVLPFRVG